MVANPIIYRLIVPSPSRFENRQCFWILSPQSASHSPCCTLVPATQTWTSYVFQKHNLPRHIIYSNIPFLIIHMKKFIDSDWLKAEQFKCNTSKKLLVDILILNYDWQKEYEKFCRPLMSEYIKQWQKVCTETLKKFFSNVKKMASRNIFRHFFCANVFMFVLLSNHTIFLV